MKLTPIFLISITAVALTVVVPATTSAQEADSTEMKELLTRIKTSDCYEYAANAYQLIPVYYAQQKFDSIDAVLQFVAERCPRIRFKGYRLLRKMEIGVLPEDFCDSAIVGDIMPATYFHYGYLGGPLFELPVLSTDAYDAMIREMAVRMCNATAPPFIHHAIATYYAYGADSVLTLLAENTYPGTCLQATYDTTVADLVDRRRGFATNWAFTAGAWVPTGELDLLGVKPEIGIQGGIRFRHFGGDLTWLFRFIDSRESYIVGYGDSLYTTDKYFDMYLGLDPVFRLYTGWSASVELVGGIGYEGIMSLPSDEIDGDAAHYISSLNLNGGFTTRLFYGQKHTKYFGLQTRVSYLDFATDGGSDLSGAAVSINLVWGNMGHGWVDNRLERLHYFR